jgi:hypothetical protein
MEDIGSADAPLSRVSADNPYRATREPDRLFCPLSLRTLDFAGTRVGDWRRQLEERRQLAHSFLDLSDWRYRP